MEPHVFYTGLIVVGVLCLIVAGAIWVLWVATDPVFDRTVKRISEVDDVLNAELAANERLLSANSNLPDVFMRADDPDIVPMPHWLDTLPVRPVIEEAKS
mgnify:CR=1 FL=1